MGTSTFLKEGKGIMISSAKQYLRDLKRNSSIYEKIYASASKAKTYLLRIVPDVPYLKYKYYTSFGKKLNLDSPKSFNEKIQWLKIYDRRKEYIKYVDKIEVKKFIDQLLGPGHTIPTLGVWNTVDEIKLEDLPDQFVLKCNHDSGGVFICRDKNAFDWKKISKRIQSALKTN